MNFSGRCFVIGSAYTTSCFEAIVSACDEKKFWKAMGNIGPLVVVSCITRIASIAENTIIGLGNILGFCFYKNCSFLRGVKCLTGKNLANGGALVVTGCLLPIALIAFSCCILIDKEASGDFLKESVVKWLHESTQLACKEWEKAGMNPSFVFPV